MGAHWQFLDFVVLLNAVHVEDIYVTEKAEGVWSQVAFLE